MTRAEQDEARIPCWFCGRSLRSNDILRDGILRGRPPAQGGPYRILPCPNCDRHNLCERTPKGRWFASPNVRLSILEYLLSQLLAPAAEDFLVAVSWFRDNEERRRNFFERDDDRRYTGKNFLLRIWPTANPSAAQEAWTQQTRKRARESPSGREDPRSRPHQEHGQERTGRARSEHQEQRQEQRYDNQKRVPGIVTPYELLGVQPDASQKEIQAAFQRLALHYHPDKVYHLGEEFRSTAHEKFTELKDAYETLLRRGPKEKNG